MSKNIAITNTNNQKQRKKSKEKSLKAPPPSVPPASVPEAPEVNDEQNQDFKDSGTSNNIQDSVSK